MSEFLVHSPENPTYEWKDESLGAALLKKLKTNGNAKFQIDTTAGKSQTFIDVYWKSIRAAQHMQRNGVKSTDVVVLCSFNSLDSCIPLLACLYLGTKVCSLDPSLPKEDCVHLLKLIDSKLIFCDEDSLELIENSLETAQLNSEIIVFGESKEYVSFNEYLVPTNTENEFKLAKVDINDTAIIFFSSGTTGLPKGICATHQGLISKFQTQDEKTPTLYEGTLNTILYNTSFYWISAVTILIASILMRSTQILSKTFEPQSTLHFIEKYKVSFAFFTPFQVYNLLSCENVEKYDLSTLRCVAVGGSVLRKTQHEALQRILPNVLVLNSYGLTETNGVVTIFDDPVDFGMLKNKFSSVGRLIQGYTVKVVDPETNQILGPNAEGEIRIKGKSMFKEYYKNPKATKETFDEEGYMMTGDIGYYDDDKCFYIVDRIKEMFKFQSWHIIPTELEGILLTHPAIKEAAVIGVPHEKDGDWPMAFVVLRTGSKASEEEIKTFFNDQVSDRKQLRAGLKIVDKLSYTPSGKIKRRDLRRQFQKTE